MRTLVLAILSLGMLSTFAQGAKRNSNKLGIKTSINISTLLGNELQNPRPKFGYTAGAYYHINQANDWSLYTEYTASFRGSRFSNGDTGYSKIALFYVDFAAMPAYKLDDKQTLSFGPYLSYLGLSSIFKGQQQKAYLNDIGIRPLDAGIGAYYTLQGSLVGFQVGGKLGLANANKDISFDDLTPATGTGGFIRSLSLEVGMIF
ncbi:MAG: hypothetical protein QMC70_02810 [Bacteroidia bacterium]|tara:strand:- start:25005 stop:25616 length:612 start_codon:yes stop_codon:yes gene_type:complete